MKAFLIGVPEPLPFKEVRYLGSQWPELAAFFDEVERGWRRRGKWGRSGGTRCRLPHHYTEVSVSILVAQGVCWVPLYFCWNIKYVDDVKDKIDRKACGQNEKKPQSKINICAPYDQRSSQEPGGALFGVLKCRDGFQKMKSSAQGFGDCSASETAAQ